MITVLMGAPGAGKSTWLSQNKKDPCHVASTQAIRVNREIDRGAYMRSMQIKAIKAAESGLSLYCDGTHTISSHRLIWLNLAKRLGVESRLICFDTPLELLLMAQKKRLHPAPTNVVMDHYKRFQKSRELCKKEGWDVIEIQSRRPIQPHSREVD